jgi:predicted transcriptional regulator
MASQSDDRASMTAESSSIAIEAQHQEPTRAPKARRPRNWLAALRADPRRAVQEHAIRCLVCGRAFRQLTNTHLRVHGLTAADYKLEFGYNRGRPLMCRVLQRLYAERAVASGLAARIRSRPILIEPELRRRGGTRAMALEEVLTRRETREHAARDRGRSWTAERVSIQST